MSVIGAAVARVEDPRVLRGETVFSEDVQLPGTRYAAFVRSTEAHAQIVAVDAEEARRMPGVVGVWSADDIDPLPLCPTAGGYMPIPGMEQPVLATGRVRFVGEAVAVVLAESRYQAADAAGAVDVRYEPLPVVVAPREAMAADAPLLFPDWGSNCVLDTAEEPLPDDFFAGADVIIDIENVNQRVASVSLEPRSVTVGPHPETGELTLWGSTQHPQKLHADICAILGLDEAGFRVIAPDVGGGFGAKSALYPEDVLLVLLARRTGRPVTWTETRTENLTTTVHGRGQTHRLRLGATNEGVFVALAGEVIADSGAYPNLAPLLMSMTTQMAPGCYAIPKVEVSARAVLTNTTPIGAFRGAGRPEATFSIERAADLVARRLGLDPVVVRRKNLIAGDFPHVTATGMIYDSGDYHAALDRLLEALDYDMLRKEQARRLREEGRPLGIGLATYVEITGALGFGETGTVEVVGDGRVRVVTGTSPHGQGHETAWSQIVAGALGVEISSIEVLHGDTRTAPSGGGTFGSRSLQFGGSAVHLAAVALADKLRRLAGTLFEANPDDIELTGGGAQVRGTPAKRLSLGELHAALADPDCRPDGFDDGLKANYFFEQDGWTFPSGAHGVVVEVDTETGAIGLLRLVAVDDCGTIMNPLIVEGQVHGGLAQGLAQALWEGVAYSPEGQPLTTNLADYLVPSACEVPHFETHAVETPSPLNPLGAKGIGESGTVGATPAAVNAVLDALAPLGVDHLEMPLSPQNVWQAINAARNT